MPPKPTGKVLRFHINAIYSLVTINVLYFPVSPLSRLRKEGSPVKFLLPTPASFSRNLLTEFLVQQLATESWKYPALGLSKPHILPKAHKTKGKPGSSAAHHPCSRHVQSVMQEQDSAWPGAEGHVPLSGGHSTGTHPHSRTRFPR